jgi:hypothetical protein
LTPVIEPYPMLEDDTSTTDFDRHYVYQGPWVFEKLMWAKPEHHIDVGSYIYYLGFFAHLVPTTFVDIRPTEAQFKHFTEIPGSILELPFADDSVPSLSCLHVIEHIGLGRYGDPLDPRGTEKAAAELSRVLQRGGNLYVSVPVGREVTSFNAHRIHHPATVLGYFPSLELVRLDGILDDGRLIEDVSPSVLADSVHACGLYWFTKAA